MPINYDYRACDCGATFAVQVDDDGADILQPTREQCFQCQPIVDDSPHLQVLRRQIRMQGRKPGAEWKREQLDISPSR